MKMRRKTVAIMACSLIAMAWITGSVIASYTEGPAPNAGDGIPDGSGFNENPGPNGDTEPGVGYGEPAPNSGDGIPDGSGF